MVAGEEQEGEGGNPPSCPRWVRDWVRKSPLKSPLKNPLQTGPFSARKPW